MSDTDDVPLNSLTTERCVLACALLDSSILTELGSILPAEHFYNDVNRLLYSTIMEMNARGDAVDVVTLADELSNRSLFAEFGGAHLLMEILESLPHAAHFRSYAKNLSEFANAREVSNAAKQILRRLRHTSADPSELWSDLVETVQTASESLSIRVNPFVVTDVATFCAEHPELPPYVVCGILRLAETMNFVSASKIGKSWLVMNLALCVACGIIWLNRFWTTKGRVLYVDNELSKPVLASRIRRVAEAMNLSPEDYAGQLDIKSLRGDLMTLDDLSLYLSRIPKGTYSLVILDAFYRFANPGMDENSNSDQTAMYNRLDQVATKMGAAIVCVIHASKGSQSGKSITDVGSGGGAMSRAADVHAVMRAHETDGAAVFDAAIRSSPPMEKFVMQFQWPLWSIDETLDPNDLKREGPRRVAKNDDEVAETKRQKEREQQIAVLEVFETHPAGDTKSQLAEMAGMSMRVYSPIHESFLRQDFITACQVQKSRKKPFDGFKVTEAGLSALRQLRQVRDSVGLSDSDSTHSDNRSSFRSGVCRSVDREVDVSLIMDAFGETSF